MRYKFRVLTSAAFAVGITLGAAAALAAPAGAAVGPKAKATPSTGLQNGTVVSLTGSGFAPSVRVDILQCNHTVATTMSAACNLSNIATATTSATGVLPATNFTVATGTIGNGTCSTTTGAPTINNTCYIVIADPSNTSDAALAKITFFYGPFAHAKPNTGLVNAQAVTVGGGGFTAGASLAIVECNHTVKITGQAACNTSSPVIVTATKTGAVPSTSFAVATGTIGNGSCVTSTSKTADNSCYIVVANIANQTQAALAHIEFQN
ncbi:MAG TPA: neocarzinostatin apoprotein domain-containing protein [Acidimicrobiales bacterium]|nr:neocarzinostatin apoprotein domain-containing protein [Acidimicrobiales bacterium]